MFFTDDVGLLQQDDAGVIPPPISVGDDASMVPPTTSIGDVADNMASEPALMDPAMIDPALIDPASLSNSSQGQDGANKKSPMDILEEILNESEQEESAEAAAAAAAAKEEAAKEAEKAAKIAAYEQALAEQKAKDALLINQQLSELKTIENTPENQARLQQIEEAKAQQEAATVAADGFEILQIDHTKIPVTE